MTNGAGSSGPEAQYISVQDVEYELAPGCATVFRFDAAQLENTRALLNAARARAR